MSRRTYRLQTPVRTVRASITETRRRVQVRLVLSAYGEFGDEQQIEDWLRPIFSRYETDPRPVEIHDPHRAQVAMVYDDRMATVRHTTTPRWRSDVAAMGATVGPGLHHITVRHDDDCPMLNGGTTCACDAEVHYGPPDREGVH